MSNEDKELCWGGGGTCFVVFLCALMSDDKASLNLFIWTNSLDNTPVKKSWPVVSLLLTPSYRGTYFLTCLLDWQNELQADKNWNIEQSKLLRVQLSFPKSFFISVAFWTFQYSLRRLWMKFSLLPHFILFLWAIGQSARQDLRRTCLTTLSNLDRVGLRAEGT